MSSEIIAVVVKRNESFLFSGTLGVFTFLDGATQFDCARWILARFNHNEFFVDPAWTDVFFQFRGGGYCIRRRGDKTEVVSC